MKPLFKHLFTVVLSLLVLLGCHSSNVSLIDESKLITPLPDEFLLSNGSTHYFGIKKGRFYSINKDSFELRISTLSRGVLWAQMRNKKFKSQKNTKEFAHYAIKLNGREVLYYESKSGITADSRQRMMSLLQNDINQSKKIQKYRLFNLKNPAQRKAGFQLVKDANDKKKAKKKPANNYKQNIYKNKFKPATPNMLTALIKRSPVDNKIKLNRNTTAEYLKLPFYKENVYLLKVSSNWKPKNLFLYYLYDGSKLTRLTGTSLPIHQFNKTHTLNINTTKQAKNYLWFFTYFLRVKQSPFLIFESPLDPYIPSKLSTAERTKIRSVMQPFTCKFDKQYNCKGTVFYSNAVFLSNFTVSKDGKVDMLDDRPVVADLKYKIDAPLSLSDISANTFSQSLSATKTPAKTAPRKSASTSSNNLWFFKEERDPIDETLKQYIYGYPKGYPRGSGGPYIRIGCYDRKDRFPMGTTLYWGAALEDFFPNGEQDMAHVTARFDKRKPMELGWSVSRDWRSTYPPGLSGAIAQIGTGLMGQILGPNSKLAKMNSTWSAKDLHKQIKYSQTAIFRGYPRSGDNITLTFDARGYSKLASRFRSHCN